MSESKKFGRDIEPNIRKQQDIQTGKLLFGGAYYDQNSLVVTDKQIGNAKNEMNKEIEKTTLKSKQAKTRKYHSQEDPRIQLVLNSTDAQSFIDAIVNLVPIRDKEFLHETLKKQIGRIQKNDLEQIKLGIVQILKSGVKPTVRLVELWLFGNLTQHRSKEYPDKPFRPSLDYYDNK